MSEVKFCYEIHADAGLAYDTETGENAEAYTEVKIKFKRELSEVEYQKAHEFDVVEMMSERLGINKDWIKPISEQEYLKNHDD